MKKIIAIQKIGDLDNQVITNLRKCLSWQFKIYDFHFLISENPISLTTKYYNFLREKYDASLILQNLFLNNCSKNYFCSLGIMNKDIFKGFHNFVFGVGVNVNKFLFNFPNLALVSIARLKESYYNNPEDDILTLRRALKESIHEIGHSLGLKHCTNECVMRFSKSIQEVDKKPLSFCFECAKKLDCLYKIKLNRNTIFKR
ncbi:MAG: hypothetical protein EU550_02620 [Promethearchaeota archaeon]|nr:MAG: hypothetical protein EU550_02620 [Candidatus Lokiarchaeota archaeon]